MNEGWMIRAAITAAICMGASGCGGTDDPEDCVGDGCSSPACSNGINDGTETDVDCGGATCRKCAGGRSCASNEDCFSGTCAAGTCFALTVSFADAVTYEAGDKPYVMLAGDLDGEGDLDLASANEIACDVSVFRNTGDSSGVFERLAGPTGTGWQTGIYPTGGAIADFNRDGIADIVTADYRGYTVSILLGEGVGDAYTLTAAASYPTVDGGETSNLAVGDLNGDQVLDVIATNPMKSSVSVLLGQVNGTLGPADNVTLGMGDAEPYSVAIADFDGDGVNDAAIADDRSRTVYVWIGNGDGTFAPGATQPMIGGGASFILIARDMDLDGNVDLVVANRATNDISVLRGRGDGDFDPPLVSTTGPDTGPYSIAVSDFNLDGVPDVVTANYMAGTASVLLGLGNGTFEAPIDTGMTGVYSYGVATGDFNGDDKPDFAIANAASKNVAVKLSTAH